MLFLDGTYSFRNNRATFHRLRRPTTKELNHLLDTLSRRIVRVLERRGLLCADSEHPYLDLEADSMAFLHPTSNTEEKLFQFDPPGPWIVINQPPP